MIDDEGIHKCCVSIADMRRAYNRSNDFSVCDANGDPNPRGGYYKSIQREVVRLLRGQCSFEFLENGDPNRNWTGCPKLTDPRDDVENLNDLLRRAK